ncbi:MAG: type II toxin-antitoxin system HicA family toxin [Planctomycetota bacterium]
MKKPPHRRLTIPDHKEVAKGALRAIIRQAGVLEFSGGRDGCPLPDITRTAHGGH